MKICLVGKDSFNMNNQSYRRLDHFIHRVIMLLLNKTTQTKPVFDRLEHLSLSWELSLDSGRPKISIVMEGRYIFWLNIYGGNASIRLLPPPLHTH